MYYPKKQKQKKKKRTRQIDWWGGEQKVVRPSLVDGDRFFFPPLPREKKGIVARIIISLP